MATEIKTSETQKLAKKFAEELKKEQERIDNSISKATRFSIDFKERLATGASQSFATEIPEYYTRGQLRVVEGALTFKNNLLKQSVARDMESAYGIGKIRNLTRDFTREFFNGKGDKKEIVKAAEDRFNHIDELYISKMAQKAVIDGKQSEIKTDIVALKDIKDYESIDKFFSKSLGENIFPKSIKSFSNSIQNNGPIKERDKKDNKVAIKFIKEVRDTKQFQLYLDKRGLNQLESITQFDLLDERERQMFVDFAVIAIKEKDQDSIKRVSNIGFSYDKLFPKEQKKFNLFFDNSFDLDRVDLLQKIGFSYFASQGNQKKLEMLFIETINGINSDNINSEENIKKLQFLQKIGMNYDLFPNEVKKGSASNIFNLLFDKVLKDDSKNLETLKFLCGEVKTIRWKLIDSNLDSEDKDIIAGKLNISLNLTENSVESESDTMRRKTLDRLSEISKFNGSDLENLLSTTSEDKENSQHQTSESTKDGREMTLTKKDIEAMKKDSPTLSKAAGKLLKPSTSIHNREGSFSANSNYSVNGNSK